MDGWIVIGGGVAFSFFGSILFFLHLICSLSRFTDLLSFNWGEIPPPPLRPSSLPRFICPFPDAFPYLPSSSLSFSLSISPCSIFNPLSQYVQHSYPICINGHVITFSHPITNTIMMSCRSTFKYICSCMCVWSIITSWSNCSGLVL